MAQACNPSTLGGRGGWIRKSRDRDHPGQHGETPSLLKIQKISWAWWRVPVIPATQEAEAGELPEPRRQRLRWAGITPLHSSLGNKSKTPSQKKKNNSIEHLLVKCYFNYNEMACWFGGHFIHSAAKCIQGWILYSARPEFKSYLHSFLYMSPWVSQHCSESFLEDGSKQNAFESIKWWAFNSFTISTFRLIGTTRKRLAWR